MRFSFLLALVLFPLLSQFTMAGLIISVQDSQINAGGMGVVDVYITGQPGDSLGRFGYEFNISGATAQSGDLQFNVVQTGAAQNQAAFPPYVFLGDTDPSNFFAARGNGGADPASLVGSDVLATLNDVSIDGTFLLARLELIHIGTLSGSHSFTVSLNPISPLTLFDKDWDAGTDNNYALAQISAVSGTVTVTAVPEPSSIVLILISTVCMACHTRIRRAL